MREVDVVTPFAPPAGVNDVLLVAKKSQVRCVHESILDGYALCFQASAVLAHDALDDLPLLASPEELAVVAAWDVLLLLLLAIFLQGHVLLANALGRHLRLLQRAFTV